MGAGGARGGNKNRRRWLPAQTLNPEVRVGRDYNSHGTTEKEVRIPPGDRGEALEVKI